MLNDTYAYVRARWVILVSIVGMVAPIFVCALLFPSWRNGLNSSLQPLENAVFGVVSYGLAGVLLWLIWGRNLGRERIFGSFPNAREVWILLSLGIPNVGLSIVGMNLLFLPLSYVAPGVVSWWLLEPEPPDFICGFSLDAILVNGIQGVQTALVVPIVEEVVFRGFVLHRWCDKYGVKRGIVQASILFSMLHKELLGNFVGSVIVSVLCLRTKSLVGPILIHVGNNLVVVLMILSVWLIGGDVEGFSDASTLKEFRSDWWYGAIGAVISVPWLYWFVKTRLVESNAKLK